jgi:hypothetical protein
LIIFKKARVENYPLHLDSTEAGVTLQLLPDDLPGPPDLSLSHRHLGDDGAEDIIIFKGQNSPQGDFIIFNWLLRMPQGTFALQAQLKPS